MKRKLARSDIPDRSSYPRCKNRLKQELIKRYPTGDIADMLQQLETMAHDVYGSFLYNTIGTWKSMGPITRLGAFYDTLEAHGPYDKTSREKPLDTMLRETYESFTDPITYETSPLSEAIEDLCYASANQLRIEDKLRKKYPTRNLRWM